MKTIILALAVAISPAALADVKLKCPPGTEQIKEQYQSGGESHFCVRKSENGQSVKHGPAVGFKSPGIKGYEANFAEGQKDGEFKLYYDNGQIKEAAHFRGGKYIGKTTWHWENGKKKAEGQYENDAESGAWTFYDSTGKKIARGPFNEAVTKFKEQQTEKDQQAAAMKEKGLMEGAPCGEWLDYQNQDAYFQQVAAQAKANGGTVEGDFPELERKTKATYGKFLLARDRFEKRSKTKFNYEWCQ